MLPNPVDYMKTQTLRYFLTLALALVLGGMSVSSFAEESVPVGTVLFVHGDVSIFSSEGEQRNASRGDEIFEGDRIVSSAASSMQIKMVDSGYLAVRPSSEIRIDKYRFEQSQNDRAETSLLRGGLRSITGTIGKTRKESFKLRTPVATIGIRGTDLEVFYVPSGRDQLLARGAYLRINSGKGYIQTPSGVQFVAPNQTGYARDKRETPKLIQLPADFFNQPDVQFWPENESPDENNQSSAEENDENRDSNFNENSAELGNIPDDTESELVDLDLPPDLLESWNSEAEFVEVPEVVFQDADLGIFDQLSSSDVVASQSGTFNYKASSLDINGATPTSSSVELNVDFTSGSLDYNLYLDFSSGSVGPVPAAVAGSSGEAWLFSGSGQLSDFLSAQGMGISGFYYDASGESAAKGIWYGSFIGTGAEELISGFTLCQGSYNADGSCSGIGLEGGMYSNSRTPITDQGPELETFSPLEGDYVLAAFPSDIAIMANGYSRLGESVDGYSTVIVSSIDGRVVAFEQSGSDYAGVFTERFESLSDETVFGYSKNDGVDTAYWGYWDGYTYTGEDGMALSTDQNFYYTYLDSSVLHTWASAARPNMQAKFNLTGGVAHDGNGRELFFNPTNSYMLMDFNAGVMSGQVQMSTSDSQENQDSWLLQTGYASLDSIYGGMGGVSLYGNVETTNSRGSVLYSGYVEGYWDFLWAGSRSNYLMGAFSASGVADTQNGSIDYSADGVLVFDESADSHQSVIRGSSLSGIAVGYGSEDYSYTSRITFDGTDPSGSSGYYESSDTSSTLVAFFESQRGLSVNNGTASLYRDQSTYDVYLDDYSLQADGTYTAVGGNGIRNTDGQVVSKVEWGRWMTGSAGDILSGDGEGIRSMDAIHYIAGTNLTPQSSIDTLILAQSVATFSFAGGTLPTLATVDGITTGSVNNLNLNVNFGQGVVDSDMSLSFNGTNIAAFGSGTLDQFLSNGVSLDAFQSETLIGTGAIQGQFVGPNADGALVGYELNTDLGVVSGAGALQKTSEVNLQAP